ncbi:heavy-metal-associated domain-containing protein [Sulfurimonas sp. SAG-AH-194-L11]|nr:cation transporter [Sulfurimonas sp. SAG-AH-194-L11]MDF1876726.1 heavy-metal-associated domain-containing protein [Sulfurimonas sp. SAG-AH-194-L11]
MFKKKIRLITLLLLCTSFMFISCSEQDKVAKTVLIKQSDIVLEKIAVDGMTCVGCEVTLEGAVLKIEGVTKVKASATDASAAVEFDKTKTDIKTIIKTIQDAGYKAKK